MKFCKIGTCAALLLMTQIACGNTEPEPVTPDPTPGPTTPEEPTEPTVKKTPTLLVKTGWDIDTVAPGVIYYNFTGRDDLSGASQIVNVIEYDLTNDSYSLELRCNINGIKCSEAFKTTPGAVAAVNAAYEHEAIYLKTNNYKISEVTLAPDHLRFWKHEGAIYWSKPGDLGFTFAGKDGADAISAYKADKHRNLVASAPMLIDNFDPCGKRFVDPSLTWDDFQYMDSEDPRRHQGVRHPRTAVALTEDRDLLLITIDGRFPGQAEGMSAREVTDFLVKYFNPRDALQMDGGGSTTMVVTGRGDSQTHIVNHPSDNSKFDHEGERSVNSHFVIKKK